MQLLVSHLMDQGLDGLDLAHPLLQGDALLQLMVVALGAALDVLKVHGHGAAAFQRGKHLLILLHRSAQLIHADGWQLPSLRLGHVEHVHHLKSWDQDLLLLGHRVSVLVQDGLLGLLIQLFHLQLLLEGRRSQDLDPLLPLQHLAAKLLLPSRVSGNQGGLRHLEGDEQGVIQAVGVEFAHGPQPGPILLRVEELLDPRLQPVGDLLDLLTLCIFRHAFFPLFTRVNTRFFQQEPGGWYLYTLPALCVSFYRVFTPFFRHWTQNPEPSSWQPPSSPPFWAG